MAESLFTKILVPVDFSPCSEEAFPSSPDACQDVSIQAIASACDRHERPGDLQSAGVIGGALRRAGPEAAAAHARLNVRRLLESESAKGVTVTRVYWRAVRLWRSQKRPGWKKWIWW
jgi:hypothetical protein